MVMLNTPYRTEQITELFIALAPSLRGYLIRLTGNEADADEVCQETFRAVLQVGEIRSAKSLVYRVATNFARQRFRHDAAGPEFVAEGPESEAVADPALNPEQRAMAEQIRERLQQVLSELTQVEQELISARYIEGLSCEEIAQRMGFPSRSAVYQRLSSLYPWVRFRLRALGVSDNNLRVI
jgi:RNA polymerase sigma-70 factor, ECF subfamily